MRSTGVGKGYTGWMIRGRDSRLGSGRNWWIMFSETYRKL